MSVPILINLELLLLGAIGAGCLYGIVRITCELLHVSQHNRRRRVMYSRAVRVNSAPPGVHAAAPAARKFSVRSRGSYVPSPGCVLPPRRINWYQDKGGRG